MSRPWMSLYVADWLADTQHLSATEMGGYLLLVMHYWQFNGLPPDERRLARIARLDAAEWSESRRTLLDFFDGNLRHKRIDKELARAEDISGKRRSAANARHHPKGNANADANANANGLQLDTQLQPQLQKKKDSVAGATGAEAPDAAAEMDKSLFAESRDKFGRSCGGQITKLKKARGVAVALDDIRRAPDGAAGLEYIAGILRSSRNGREQINDAFEWLDEQIARQNPA